MPSTHVDFSIVDLLMPPWSGTLQVLFLIPVPAFVPSLCVPLWRGVLVPLCSPRLHASWFLLSLPRAFHYHVNKLESCLTRTPHTLC